MRYPLLGNDQKPSPSLDPKPKRPDDVGSTPEDEHNQHNIGQELPNAVDP